MGHALLSARAIVLLFLLNPYIAPHASLLHVGLKYSQGAEYLRYSFIIDEEGGALVRIMFHSSRASGSFWIFVPRFSEWLNYTTKGRVFRWTLEDPEKYTGSQYYFYKVLEFQFISDGSEFEIVVEYNFSLAAMVVETESTYGIFYSPQIGFKGGSEFEAAVIFPPKFRADLNEALAVGGSLYRPDKALSNSSFVLFRGIPATENLLRIQIGFRAIDREPSSIILESGVFRFNTVKRYEPYAWKILNLYNLTYNMLINLFNTTLGQYSPSGENKGVTIRFFVPDFNSLMSIGGYVPFSGRDLGDIYVNLMFTRYIEGYLEVIALHELIHHFLWKAGISPQNLLWFHEGMAQYVSLEVAGKLGYEGAKMIKDEIEDNIKNIVLTYNSLSFLLDWTPTHAPRDLNTLYTAAYYVVNRLAAEYGGLDYYARFFKILSGKTLRDNVALCYYLSVAANESVADKLNSFGFNIPDLYAYWPLISEVEEAIKKIDSSNVFLKPFRDLANLIYRVGVSGERIFVEWRHFILLAALLTAYFAPLLALLAYSSLIFTALIILLKVKGVLSDRASKAS